MVSVISTLIIHHYTFNSRITRSVMSDSSGAAVLTTFVVTVLIEVGYSSFSEHVLVDTEVAREPSAVLR